MLPPVKEVAYNKKHHVPGLPLMLSSSCRLPSRQPCSSSSPCRVEVPLLHLHLHLHHQMFLQGHQRLRWMRVPGGIRAQGPVGGVGRKHTSGRVSATTWSVFLDEYLCAIFVLVELLFCFFVFLMHHYIVCIY